MTKRYLEDFAVGQTFGSRRLRVDEEQIKAFAAEFDPQPFHLDEEVARDTIFRGLAASGWHTAALTMRLQVESGITGGRDRRCRRRRVALAAARAARRRATGRERGPRAKAVTVAPKPRDDQDADEDAEPERRGGAGFCCKSDRVAPRQLGTFRQPGADRQPQ